jgi:hypothetical protein
VKLSRCERAAPEVATCDIDPTAPAARGDDFDAAEISQLEGVFVLRRKLEKIKLANAIVTGTRVRLVDFELAAQVGSELLVPAGTHGYMPPESEAQVELSWRVKRTKYIRHSLGT